MPLITCIEDLRILAKKRVPRVFYDYADSGSWTEQTYRANTTDFEKIRLRQKVAVNMEGRETAVKVVGQDASMPIGLAPVGLTGMQHADGEILACRAAQAFGVPYILSTMSICSIEDVADAVEKPFWFQLYVMRDRSFANNLIDRAKAAGCSALVLTLDLQIIGQRHKDLKNGLGAPPKLTVANMIDMATKPRWGLGMLGTKKHTFRNIVGHADGINSMGSLAAWTNSQFDQSLTWDDIDWVRDRWDGKLILKGILDADDAERAVEKGADAIVVSNHGGRQLDGALSSLAVLHQIAERVKGRTEVHFDGGIRTGQDVLKAVALGADFTYVGRAYAYGLGAMGQAGVTRALEVLYSEFDTTMALCGRTKVADLNRENLIFPQDIPAPFGPAT